MFSMTLIPYTITWDAPSSDGGSKINKYQSRFAINKGYSEWIDLDSSNTRFIALLPNDVDITIEIRAVNEVGPGEANIIKVRPIRKPNSRDAKKRIGDKSVNINLPNHPVPPEI